MSADLTAHLDLERCIEDMRALIRIPSVNPPGMDDTSAGRDTTGAETAAAGYCAEVLAGDGIEAEVVELTPGRGSCIGRLPRVGLRPPSRR